VVVPVIAAIDPPSASESSHIDQAVTSKRSIRAPHGGRDGESPHSFQRGTRAQGRR
jgi:hypothetical protein